MSLVRLLKSGKCLTDLKNSTSVYRMRRASLLPKFGSDKNPFTPTAPAQLIQIDAPIETERRDTPAADAGKSQQGRPISVAAPSSGRPEDAARPALSGRRPGRIRRWSRKLNPLNWWTGRKPVRNPAIPDFAKGPVQGELSLDNIRVVRNDLCDADVDIVPAKPSRGSVSEAAEHPAPRAELAKS
jgi:hypothetical protein